MFKLRPYLLDSKQTYGISACFIQLSRQTSGSPEKKNYQSSVQVSLSYDVWSNERAEVSTAHPREGCRACQQHEFVHLAGEGRPPISLCGRNSAQIHEVLPAVGESPPTWRSASFSR